jgi:hypothetical protein
MPGHFSKFDQLGYGEPPLGDADVENYIFSHRNKHGWEDAPKALRWANGRNDRSILLPFFENECDRAYAPENPDLKELRRLTHYLESRLGMQTDLPKETIATMLRDEAGREKFESTLAKQDDQYIDEQSAAWDEDIVSYASHGNLEAALRRIEGMAAKLNNDLDRIVSLKTSATNEEKIERLKTNLKKIRAARSTLLEQYFAPGSLH